MKSEEIDAGGADDIKGIDLDGADARSPMLWFFSFFIWTLPRRCILAGTSPVTVHLHTLQVILTYKETFYIY